MAYCTGCGAQISETARFCPECGTANAAHATEATPSDPSLPPPPTSPVPPVHTPLAGSPIAEGSGGAARWILPIVVVIAAAAIAVLLWSQREGARPIAGSDRSVTAAADDTETGETAADSARSDETPSSGRSVDAARSAVERLTSGPVTATTATALDGAFLDDPVAAARRYPGPVEVTGTIATMVTPGPTPALSLEGRNPLNYMVVSFPRGYRERLASLSKGDRITVRCQSVQAMGGTTILDDCEL